MTNQPHESSRILVVDDDRIIVESLAEFLRMEGHDVASAGSFAEAVRQLNRGNIDLVLSDVNLPGGNGFELLHVARQQFPNVVVIMMTGYGTIESAVESIKLGAYDYLTKPIIDDELRLCLERAMAQHALLRENRTLKAQLGNRFGLDAVIGHDYRMLKVFELVESVADAGITVLLQGASGTGKSLMAKVIHQMSPRRDKPFVEVSCGSLPDSLLESELFGHVRGAFTGAVANKAGKFQVAHKGTLFLDEITAASPALQVKLLRVLQSQQFEAVGSNKTETVDVRVIVACNDNLEQLMHEGRFREDLFYRVNVVTLDLPTLAERGNDVPLLATHFLKQHAMDMNRRITGFDHDALTALQRYRWPGNVRELENVVARAVVLSKDGSIGVSALPDHVTRSATCEPEGGDGDELKPLKEAMEQPERRILEAALLANGWNRQLTADQLRINRTTLYKKMKRYGLSAESSRTR